MMAFTSVAFALAFLGIASVQGLLNTCSQPGYSDGNYPHPGDCQKFLQCNNGQTIVLTCPNDLYYNEDKRLCDTLDHVSKCQPTTAPPYVDVSNICNFNNWVDGSYPYPGGVCTKYIQCNNGMSSVVTCPDGLVYNEIRRLCDHIENVPNCSLAVTVPSYTTASIPTDLTLYCQYANLPDGSYSHPTDCHMYIQCRSLVTFIISCPTGLVYNAALRRCDFPSNVPSCDSLGTRVPVTPTGSLIGYDTYCLDNNLSTGIHPDPFSCYYFVECTFGRTDHMACPDGLAFSVTDSVCIEANKVDCTQNIIG